jgi:hypothetical protein
MSPEPSGIRGGSTLDSTPWFFSALLLGRIATRTTNDYGKSSEDRDFIVQHLAEVFRAFFDSGLAFKYGSASSNTAASSIPEGPRRRARHCEHAVARGRVRRRVRDSF